MSAAQHCWGLDARNLPGARAGVPLGAPDWIRVQQIDGQPFGALAICLRRSITWTLSLISRSADAWPSGSPMGTRRFRSLNSGPCRNGLDGFDFVCPQDDITEFGRKPQSSCAGWAETRSPRGRGLYNKGQRGPFAAAVDAALPPNQILTRHGIRPLNMIDLDRLSSRERTPCATMPANAVCAEVATRLHKAVRPGVIASRGWDGDRGFLVFRQREPWTAKGGQGLTRKSPALRLVCGTLRLGQKMR